jgi:hypothetical protein
MSIPPTITETSANNAPNQIDAVAKIYPFIGKDKNRKGYYIGNYQIVIKTEDLPFSNFDQVDHMIYNLYNYAKTRKNPKDFFIYHPEKMTFIPGKINKMSGGKKRSQTRRKLASKKQRKTMKKQ